MAEKRSLKDAAHDSVAVREIAKKQKLEELSKSGHSKVVLITTFIAGIAAGIILSRLLKQWFLKV